MYKRQVKVGVGEIDFLAVRPSEYNLEAWHVEVQVSFRPIGYIGGNTSAKKRTFEQISDGINQWIAKKFTDERKQKARDKVLPNGKWKYVLVCAEVKDEREIELLKEHGVKVFRYKDIIDSLIKEKSKVNSTAGNIVEILRYAKMEND